MESEKLMPMTTIEPTTGEIVWALRGSCLVYSKVAADRLESQERIISDLTDAVGSYIEAVRNLNARAEQAERERDAAELKNQAANVFIERIHLDFKGYMPSEYYEKRDAYVKRRRELGERGLPQD